MRLKRLWRKRIARFASTSSVEQRVKDNHKASALKAVESYSSALEAIGERQSLDEAAELRKQLETGVFPTAETAPPDSRKIDEPLFWQLIESSKVAAVDQDEQLERLRFQLTAFAPAQIKLFHKLLQAKLCEINHWDVWALAYIRNGGCSDDGFEYVRAGLILQGRPVFEALVSDVVAAAKLLPAQGSLEAEELLSIAPTAYEQRSGEQLKIPAPRCKLKGEEWDEDEVETKYPALVAAILDSRNRRVA